LLKKLCVLFANFSKSAFRNFGYFWNQLASGGNLNFKILSRIILQIWGQKIRHFSFLLQNINEPQWGTFYLLIAKFFVT